MSTAVLDIDYEDIPAQITGLESYNRAFILIRLRDRPVAQTTIPVISGCVTGAELREAIRVAADWTFWEAWLKARLNWDERGQAGHAHPGATIAVCTRDRPTDLKRCLDALMRLPDDGQEVMVVDNCPSDDACFLTVQSYPRVRYVREDRPGLNHARNRALQEARHDIVAFTDDDAVVDEGWLRALLANLNDEMVLCVTGLTLPLEMETMAQEQFELYTPFGRGLRRLYFDRSNHPPLAGGRVGVGANMALRKSVLDRVGLFDPALDAGTQTLSGGDNEMFSRIMVAGYRIIYDPAALSWHRHRSTMPELERALYGYGVGVSAAWSSLLLNQGEFSVLYYAWQWFYRVHIPALWRALLQVPGAMPLNLILAQVLGSLVGPWAYVRSALKLRGASHVHRFNPQHHNSHA